LESNGWKPRNIILAGLICTALAFACLNWIGCAFGLTPAWFCRLLPGILDPVVFLAFIPLAALSLGFLCVGVVAWTVEWVRARSLPRSESQAREISD
jgi:hypothetical protein